MTTDRIHAKQIHFLDFHSHLVRPAVRATIFPRPASVKESNYVDCTDIAIIAIRRDEERKFLHDEDCKILALTCLFSSLLEKKLKLCYDV